MNYKRLICALLLSAGTASLPHIAYAGTDIIAQGIAASTAKAIATGAIPFNNGTTGASTITTQAELRAGAVNAADYPTIDPTGTVDSISGFQAAINTGRDVHIPPGNYIITAGWLDIVTPGQTVFCDSPATKITVSRGSGAYAPSPAVIIEAAAVGARLKNCTIDHNGAQFLTTGAFVPLAWNNTTVGTHANDALGSAVLIMANFAEAEGVKVLNGWDNCTTLGLYSLTTGTQSGGQPFSPKYRNGYSGGCGAGTHSWTPSYHQGAGVDVATASAAIVTDSIDWQSYNGFWVDVGGGASAELSNLVSYYNPVSVPLQTTCDKWHTGNATACSGSLGGNCFYISGANRDFSGSNGSMPIPAAPTAGASLWGTNGTNLKCVGAQGVGFWVDAMANGGVFDNVRVIQSGLEAMYIGGGTTVFNNTYIDQANYLKGYAGFGTAGPATAAIQVTTNSNSSDTSAAKIFNNTTAIFNNLVVTNKSGTPNYTYDVAVASFSPATATAIIRGFTYTPGTSGNVYYDAGSTVVYTGANLASAGQFSGLPTLGACGTSPALAQNSTWEDGTVTAGSGSPTTCTVNFATGTQSGTPKCIVTSPTGGAMTSYAPGYSGLTISASPFVSGQKYTWHCTGG